MLKDSADYQAWVATLKQRLKSLQLKAALAVNAALLEFLLGAGGPILLRSSRRQLGGMAF